MQTTRSSNLVYFRKVLAVGAFTVALTFMTACGSGSSGSSGNPTGNPPGTPTPGNPSGSGLTQFLYAVTTNATTSALTGFAVDGSGKLAAVGTPLQFPAPTSSSSPQAAADPSRKFIYETSGDSIVTYSVGHDGTLTQTSAVAAPTEGFQILPEPSGHFLYAGSFGGNAGSIYTYSINQATGQLTQLGQPQQQPFGLLLMDPKGRFLFVVNIGQIQAFTINTSTGALTPAAMTTGLSDDITQVAPNGKFLYTGPAYPRGNGFQWTGYVIDPSTGTLTTNGQETAFGNGGTAFDPSATHLFVNDTVGIRVFSIDSTSGKLVEISGSPFSRGAIGGNSTNGEDQLAVDSTGKFLFITDGQKLGTFAISADGSLTPASGAPVALTGPPSTAISLFTVQSQ